MAIDVLTGMRVFAAVVDSMSFAKAAEQLNLSRGMTSRYVAQIESHLGVRLLNRTTRHLSLTEAGQDYYQRATQVLALVEDAERAAARETQEPRGTLRIAASMAFGTLHLGPVVSRFLQRYPQVKAELSLNDRTVDLVEEGFDLGIRISRRIDPGLVARPIARANFVACASPAYLARHGTPKKPEDLARHNCLTYSYSGQEQEWAFTRRGQEARVKVAGNLHGNNGNIICSAAADGLGVIVQPTFISYELVRSGQLVRILANWEVAPSTIYAVYPNRQFLPPKVRSFIDFMLESFGGNPYWDNGIIK
jgi:DNA-binding transcriptional LysR family regulator